MQVRRLTPDNERHGVCVRWFGRPAALRVCRVWLDGCFVESVRFLPCVGVLTVLSAGSTVISISWPTSCGCSMRGQSGWQHGRNIRVVWVWRWTRPCDLVPFLLRTRQAGGTRVAAPASTTHSITTETSTTTRTAQSTLLFPPLVLSISRQS